ncbi:hypothetical protein PHZ_c1724 [Phenylobacterium zucineum HLK1]|uniref:Uncharacterized protein n=1 Tax=Phenylobacterium zucineum (strain HLK1) TaxID=450851 RepID=B4RBT8_PHEZH|nr:hypothetical protein PHZ_c1724 [Phenylobacterium zucineum HLK1]
MGDRERTLRHPDLEAPAARPLQRGHRIGGEGG